jgi:hypothetical protein
MMVQVVLGTFGQLASRWQMSVDSTLKVQSQKPFLLVFWQNKLHRLSVKNMFSQDHYFKVFVLCALLKHLWPML